MQKEDDTNTNELVETNKNLCNAMEKLEQRCRILEEKITKLKEFKRMVQNSTSMQCATCSKHIATRIFMQHLESCAPDDLSTTISTTPLSRS